MAGTFETRTDPIYDAAQALVIAAQAVLAASHNAPRALDEPLAALDSASDALGALLEG